MRTLYTPVVAILFAILSLPAAADPLDIRGDIPGDIKNPQDFLNPGGPPEDSIFFVGSWHFAYPGKDAHKTDASNRIDVLSDERQQEIEETLAYLERYRPTAIGVECDPGSAWEEKYREYLDGDMAPVRNEIYQLGFRLAKRMGLERVHCVDAGSFYGDHREEMKRLGAIPEEYDYQSDDVMSKRYREWYDYMDRIRNDMTILEGLQLTNREDVLDAGFGAYLVGDFKLPEFGGADALAVYWYNRNLRIFRQLQELRTEDEDRLLVVFGSGHVQILKTLADSSPEFRRVRFDALE